PVRRLRQGCARRVARRGLRPGLHQRPAKGARRGVAPASLQHQAHRHDPVRTRPDPGATADRGAGSRRGGRPDQGMAMNSRVLIGFADALAGIESAWCLADHGFEVHAFTRRGTRPAMARSRKVRVVEVTAPEDDALACAAEIADAAARLAPAAVLPLDDHAVWLCDRAFGESRPAMVAGPTGP